MTTENKALIIAVTWVGLLVLYGINRFLLKKGLLPQPSNVVLSNKPVSAKPPGTFLTKTGVLFVFTANIVPIFLLFFDALSEVDLRLELVSVNLPLWINAIGGVLFVFNTIWGFFAMVFNSNYTPLYKLPPIRFVLANRGPYRLVRHPRYASEASLNIILFLLTDMWLPLLGIIGWVAIYHQARAEEAYLMSLAPKEYGVYRERTSMFIPKFWKNY